uniref:Reverse transcriptase domain-containing protein n=1 Tax=Tanacetum cinerariifolium TaxID=118510 RepID=A0A6L2JKN6_TANCI|nr:hypothetical protein [Tanacetum cinerariifolium]
MVRSGPGRVGPSRSSVWSGPTRHNLRVFGKIGPDRTDRTEDRIGTKPQTEDRTEIRSMRNNDLRTELEYFSEDYDEEREMEPRPKPARAITPPLRASSPRVHRRREIVVGFEETQNRGESRVKKHQRWKAFERSTKREWKSKCKPSPTFTSPHREKRERTTFAVFPDFHLRRSLRVDSNTPLVGFSRKESWSLREISLEVTIGEGPLTITKALTFVIVRSDSPHNILLGRTAMQEIGIVVSIVHGAIKFHTPNGVGIIFLEHNSQRSREEEGNSTNNGQGNAKNILSCIDTEEKTVIDDEYPEQKITIARQLPTRIKIHMRDLLRAQVDVFSWTTAHITGVPRTLIIREETFSTEHQLNLFKHIKPIKQNKRSLAPERNEAVRTQVEELVEAGVLQEVKYQTWVSNRIIVNKDDGK